MGDSGQGETQSVHVDALKSGLKLRAGRQVVLVVSGLPPPPDPRFRNTKPRILRVDNDQVHVMNAQGREEVVSLADFETFWYPGNPGNPAVTSANEAYTRAFRSILLPVDTTERHTELSWELDHGGNKAPDGVFPELRVKRWLQKYLTNIEAAERKWEVDRRAIAGAVAWEALENPKTMVHIRFSGPGKVHYWDHETISGEYTHGPPSLAKELEDKGKLPKQTEEDRKKLLETTSGAIEYIAASMNAFIELGRTRGYELNCDVPVLTFFFNSKTLAKATAETFSHKTFPDPLSPGTEKMGPWVKKNMAFLEDCVGTPAMQLCSVAKAKYSDGTP